ncbi:FecR family protein [Butyricimonas paravirosa]
MEKEYIEREMEVRLLAYFNEELEEEERHVVERWVEEKPENRKVFEAFLRDCQHIRWIEKEQSINLVQGKKLMMRRVRRVKIRQICYKVVASVAIIVTLGGVYLLNDPFEEDELSNRVETIHPGSSKAKLVLSSGKVVDLMCGSEDVIREQDGSFVKVKEKRGLVYDTSKIVSKTDQLLYNKIIVPRGGEFFVTLTDGTSVWLNADSELEYPVQFAKNKREVRLKGEAYFMVCKDTMRPFMVHSGEYSLRVYGTEFNLNTYKLDEIQAVLVKGAIGFRANGMTLEKQLKPNQLAVVNTFTGESKIMNVDVHPYIAWKDQDIVFVNERLESIMDKVARWYDVNVFFERESLKEVRFYGNMQRYADIEELLSLLEKISDVRFSIKGRTVIVSEQ